MNMPPSSVLPRTHSNFDLQVRFQNQPTVPLDVTSIIDAGASGGGLQAQPGRSKQQDTQEQPSVPAIGTGSVTLPLKTCPVCRTKLFEDMDICYNCMYLFGSNPMLEKRLADELDSFKKKRVEGKQPCDTNVHEETYDLEKELERYRLAKAEDGREAGRGDMSSAEATLSTNADGIKAEESKANEPNAGEPQTGELKASESTEKLEKLHPARKEPLYENALFGEFLIEFQSFLGNFLLDRDIGIK